MPVRWIAVLAVVLLLASCGGPASGIVVSDAWVRNSPMMERAGAAYLVIRNTGTADDRLVSASTDVCKTVELHETKDMGGMMQMSPVERIDVPAGGQAELKPGGLHVMLIDLTKELRAGDKVTLKLKFEKAGEIEVVADVRD